MKEIAVFQHNEDRLLNIALKIESPLNRVSIFWMETGERLVMDLFNEPMDWSCNRIELSSETDTDSSDNPEKTPDGDNENRALNGLMVRMKIPEREMKDIKYLNRTYPMEFPEKRRSPYD